MNGLEVGHVDRNTMDGANQDHLHVANDLAKSILGLSTLAEAGQGAVTTSKDVGNEDVRNIRGLGALRYCPTSREIVI